MAITIDTHAAIRDLEAAGADAKLAEAIVRTISQVGTELSTRGDLVALRADARAALARLEQCLTLRSVTIAAIASGTLFAALRYLSAAG